MTSIETPPTVSRRGLLAGAVGIAGATLLARALPTGHDVVVAEPKPIPAAQPPLLDLKHHLPRNHFIRSGPEQHRRVAITVDDFSQSYAPRYLAGLLQLGRQTDTRFTLFPIGQSLANQYGDSRRIWRQAIDLGHVIGNHTWDHDEQLATGSPSHIEWELVKQRQILNKVVGHHYDQFLMRPPGGSGGFPNDDPSSSNEQQHQHLMGVVRDMGYWMTMWSTDSNNRYGRMVTPGDTPAEQDARFLDKIFHGVDGNTYERVTNGSIILVHPNTLTIGGMRLLIDGLHQREYECVTVPDLFIP